MREERREEAAERFAEAAGPNPLHESAQEMVRELHDHLGDAEKWSGSAELVLPSSAPALRCSVSEQMLQSRRFSPIAAENIE